MKFNKKLSVDSIFPRWLLLAGVMAFVVSMVILSFKIPPTKIDHPDLPPTVILQQVVHLNDGRYIFNYNGTWYYYLTTHGSTFWPSVYTIANQPYSFYTNDPRTFILPSGGIWISAKKMLRSSAEQLELPLSERSIAQMQDEYIITE